MESAAEKSVQSDLQQLREKVARLEKELRSLKEKPAVDVKPELAEGHHGHVGGGNDVHDDEEVERQLSKLEIARYGRQLILPEIGISGQRRLKNTSVLIVGAGGLGAPVAMYLASCGIGHLGLVDYDDVELGNLHRQVIHDESKLSMPKVHSAAHSIGRMNRECKCTPYNMALDSSNALPLIKRYDIVVDATDNVATRYLLNDACVLCNKVLVSGSALRMEGQLTVYNHGEGPCYRCLFPTPPPPETVTNCSDGGVLGVVPGIIGTLQALEVIKLAVGMQPSYSQKLLLFDAVSGAFRQVKLRGRSASCAINGESPTIHELIDYVQFCGAGPHDKTPARALLKAEERITCTELQQMRKDNIPLLLVDVRDETQFAICAIPDSLNIPLKKLPKRLADINENHIPVYFICRRGNDSQDAARMMHEAYPGLQVKDVVGGLYRWALEVDSEFPVY